MDRDLSTMIHEAADYLRGRGVTEPDTGVILGTGLNNYVDVIEDPIIIPYGDIPYMNPGRVDGHRGQLIYGCRKGRKVVIMAGRYHYYESGDIRTTAFPARVLIELGIRRMIITNAAGCVNENCPPVTGDVCQREPSSLSVSMRTVPLSQWRHSLS